MEKQKNFTFEIPLLRTFHQQIPVLPATKYKMSCLLSRMLLFISSKIPAKSCQLEMKILKFNKLKMLKKSKSKYLIAIHVPICHVYMKFSLRIKDSTFFLIVLEKSRNLGSNVGNVGKS